MSDISILNIFEPKVRNNIIEFCKDINATHADMYVVMARKAACLVSVLEKKGLLSLHGEVISDRVMDCDIDWRKYKSVVIIDDVVISGTTLYQTINKIKRDNSALRIELHVLGVNKNWYKDEVLECEGGRSYIHAPIRRFDNPECIRLSGDIVRMLASYPLPYNIDYPIYNTLRLNSKGFEQVITLPGWKVAEVSSFSNRPNDIIAYTFMPDEETLEDCGPVYMTEAIRHALLKIRTYCRIRTDKKHTIYIMTIVPMIVLPPLEIATLDNIFGELAGSDYSELSNMLISSTARLRFVQFVLADLLARRFLQAVNRLLDVSNSIEREYGSLRYLFPSTVINNISEIANHYEGTLNQAFPYRELEVETESNSIKELLDVNDVLIRPFLEMYYNEELRSRALVREHKKKVFVNEAYASIVDRLKRGISLGELLGKLTGISEHKRLMLVSSFLDKFIDAGIVVPITVEKDNLVYRAFRHGEDVQFGQQEERLCYDMLSVFSDAIGRGDIPKLWMEKMLVLLFQLGEGDIFAPIQTSVELYGHISGELVSDIASVRYYLQGPVVVRQHRTVPFLKQYLSPKDKADWMSSKLVRDRTSPVEITKSGTYTFNESKYRNVSSGDTEIVVDKKKSKFARELGRVFGVLLCNGMHSKKPALNGDDLVMLTSSLETKNVIGAMAAEINICYEMFSRPNEKNSVDNILKDIHGNESEVEEKFELIRKGKWYQALNDGIRKFGWYCDEVGYNVIDNVAAQFNDGLYGIIWDGLWSPNMEKRGNGVKREVEDMAYVEGLWLLSAHAYYLMLYCLLLGRRARNFQDAMKKIVEINGRLNEHAHKNLVGQITKIIAEFLANCNDSNYVLKTIPVVRERLGRLFEQCPKILRKANAYYINSLNVPQVKYYNHALFIETPNKESGKIIKSLLGEIRFMINKSNGRKDTGLILVQSADNALELSELQYVFVANNNNGLYWLLELASIANSKARGCGGTRMILFAGLNPDCYIKSIRGLQIDGQSFGGLLLRVLEKINVDPFDNDILYVISERNYDIRRWHPDFKTYKRVYEETYSIGCFKKLDYELYKYQTTNNGFCQKADIAILTIVDEEAAAVRSGFGMNTGNPIVLNDRYYDYGEYSVNGKTFKVVHLQCLRQGNTPMAMAACEVVSLFNPTRMVLLGIAGGIKKDVNIGDVVIAEDSHQHHFSETPVFARCGMRAVGTNESNTYRRTERENTVLRSANQYSRTQPITCRKWRFLNCRGSVGSLKNGFSAIHTDTNVGILDNNICGMTHFSEWQSILTNIGIQANTTGF